MSIQQIDQFMEQKQKQDLPRSKLSKSSFIKWLRTRFNNTNRPNPSYLYFPQELIRETSMEQIFKEFDFDGSGGLSRDQVFEMFNGFGIGITMDDLDQLYDSVQVNLQEMDCDMFKKCALSQKSNRVFREIVRKLDAGSYLPHNFTSMIIYLVYLSKRQELRQAISKQKNSINQKVERVESLLKLHDLTLNNQRLNIHADGFKQSLRNKFRDVWERVNESYGQKYPHTQKLEEEFHQFYKMHKERKQTKIELP